MRDYAGIDVFDAMTTLYGIVQPRGESISSFTDVMMSAQWSTELHFVWWDAATEWTFGNSFTTIATPWYQDLEVKAIFVRTTFGALACTLFPWAC